MEDLVGWLANGHVTAVKIVLTSVVTALAVYQALLMAVGYGRLRPPFLQAGPASAAHRAVGDAIVALVVLVGLACLAYYGIEDRVEDGAPGPASWATWHVVVSFALAGVLALKLVVLHRWTAAGRFLPLLGISVLTLFVMTWLTSAGAFLLLA